MLTNEVIFFTIFLAFIVGMLVLDLGVFSRKSHIVSFKEAASWSAVWVVLALAFYAFLNMYGYLIHDIHTNADLIILKEKYASHLKLYPNDFELNLQLYTRNMGLEFITGYLTEYALSVDNIFVMLLIFSSFRVREIYYKKVLFWGILGAIIMRFGFIFLGSAMIQKAEWVLYLFGSFLVFTGIRSFINRNNDEEIEPKNHPVVKMVSKYLSVTPRYVGSHFFVKKAGKFMVTPLFVVVLIIEFTDLIFAVDSVPAVFSITKDPYIVFFSNIFAILGLRSMFFFLTNIMHLFHYLKIGLSFLLLYIGGKMLAHHYLEAIGFKTQYSLFIIMGILTISVVASLVFPQKKQEKPAPTPPEPVKPESPSPQDEPSWIEKY